MTDRLEQLITLGREHYNAREYDRAEKYLAEVVEMRPTFPDIFNMLGVIYHAQGRFGEAEEAFENALRINPNYTEAALNLSVTYNDRGKYDKAREVYARVMSTSYDQPRSLDPFARGKIANMHADLGEVYSGFGLNDEAVREYSRALDLCPDFVDLRVRLGNVYRDMGLFNAAISELEHAKRIKPEYLPARINLGMTLFSLGRRDDAIREWTEVLVQDPGNKNARLYLKMVQDEHVHAGSALAKSEPEPEPAE
ncbi:MAG: tetratricopeptide repeat protein [Kofleriaceae bacterium]|nr:tetratricopeptide repeat protein [Myxococcales bacterium]MCB9558809.1 tetratricopeptide repeat protein [Kofleriaceae bacterium]MCB9570636.1 tetratricopeptide repeat protein [Kofleriaceae bacterium]